MSKKNIIITVVVVFAVIFVGLVYGVDNVFRRDQYPTVIAPRTQADSTLDVMKCLFGTDPDTAAGAAATSIISNQLRVLKPVIYQPAGSLKGGQDYRSVWMVPTEFRFTASVLSASGDTDSSLLVLLGYKNGTTISLDSSGYITTDATAGAIILPITAPKPVIVQLSTPTSRGTETFYMDSMKVMWRCISADTVIISGAALEAIYEW